MKKNHENLLPTGRLLINAFRAFEKQLLSELQQRGFSDITLSHLNVIRHLNPEGMKLVELAKDAALTKQAVGKIANNLEDKGYISLVSDSNDGRAKMVKYSEKGASLIDSAIEITANIEEQYQQLLGAQNYSRLRNSLSALIEDAKNAK